MQSKIKTSDQDRQSFIEIARRKQIIECAIVAIAELGFGQASLAQIAKRAGISTGVISYYFAGKDDLIREVAVHVYATGEAFIRPRVNAETTATDALRTFIEASVAFIAAYPNFGLAIMNIIRGGGDDDRGGPRFDPMVEEPRSAGFHNILEWGQQTGEFRTFSVPVMTVTIIEALDGLPQQLARNPDLDLPSYAVELAELFDRATRNS